MNADVPILVWNCGHDRVPENTVVGGNGQCKACNHQRSLDSYRSASPAEKRRRFDLHRRRYLPAQIEATRHKLAMLEREAARLGMIELLSSPQSVKRFEDHSLPSLPRGSIGMPSSTRGHP